MQGLKCSAAAERLYHLRVERPWDGRRRSAVDALMGGLKGDVAICPKTEDHAERHSERNQADRVTEHCEQLPKHQQA